MQNGLLNPPTGLNYQSSWHRDLNYQHWTSSKAIAINALFCLDNFTLENGCTYALPGTHLRPEFPTDNFIKKHEVALTAPAGSVIIMDAMLFHRAGHNRSDSLRRAVNHVIGLPFLAQQISLAEAYPDLVTNAFEAMYFGQRWRPAANALEWRSAKRKWS